jgi:hypothetical protein
MSFFSWWFLLFTAGALLLYYLLPKKGQWAVLLCLSLGFYAFGGWKALVFLGFTAAVTFGAGLLWTGSTPGPRRIRPPGSGGKSAWC